MENNSKKRCLSPESRAKISHSTMGREGYWTGKTRSQETKNKIGNSHKGLKHTVETKEKMSAAHMGSKNHRAREIVMLDNDGRELCRFGSISDASRTLHLTVYQIRSVCLHKKPEAGGYKWKFAEEE